MEKSRIDSFLEYFSKLKDPRVKARTTYPFDEILLIALCATICGAEGWADFVLFGKGKLDFLRKYLPFKNGIPTRLTFSRVFWALDPEGFKECLYDKNNKIKMFGG